MPEFLKNWQKVPKKNIALVEIEEEFSLMDVWQFLDESFWTTLIVGLFLISGVLVFGWFEYRRNVRLPHLGMILVKNRLKNPN